VVWPGGLTSHDVVGRRALARDVGAGLGIGGHLTALRRTRVGTFGLDESRALEQFEQTPRLRLADGLSRSWKTSAGERKA